MSVKKQYKKVAVGGTFDRFHNGHKKMLNEAFNKGEIVVIGITSDTFAEKKVNVESCKKRTETLRRFVEKKHANFYIFRLDDPYGLTIHEADFDAIVVSEETKLTALEINNIRKNRNMATLTIILISFVYAEDGIPISSTRIREGEINTKGHLLK